MAISGTKLPKVSVVIAARNEENRIGQCLEAFRTQDYPLELLEIIVADGCSTDRTRDIVRAFSLSPTPAVKLVDNPVGHTPAGFNAAIREANGAVILIFSAHARPHGDLVRLSVQFLLERPDVAGVGGRLVQEGETYISQSIAAARATPVGGGLSPYRYSASEQLVSTIVYGAYRRDVFDRVGFMDETLRRNQDNEFNARVVKAGYQLLFSPKIVSCYYGRTSFSHLASQMYQYGYWKPFEYRKDPRDFRLSEVVPLLFLLGLPVLAVLPFLLPEAGFLSLTVLGLYLMVLGVGTCWAGMRSNWRVALLVPLIIPVIHLAIGLGELHGFLRSWGGWKD